jgi:hypothetical protein
VSVQPLRRPLADTLRRSARSATDDELVSALLTGLARRGEHLEDDMARRLAAIFADNSLSLFTTGQEIGLLAWVAARMRAKVSGRMDSAIAGDTDALPASDREALAHDVGVVLELHDDAHGEHGAAWSLCELAGRHDKVMLVHYWAERAPKAGGVER